jgi:hypothetical protein
MLRSLMCIAFAVLVFNVSPGLASEFGTKDEAVLMVKRVQEKFRKDGAEATFKAVTGSDTLSPSDFRRETFTVVWPGKCAGGLSPSRNPEP